MHENNQLDEEDLLWSAPLGNILVLTIHQALVPDLTLSIRAMRAHVDVAWILAFIHSILKGSPWHTTCGQCTLVLVQGTEDISKPDIRNASW